MCARMYVRMYEQNWARDHFSDIRFAAAYPRTLSLTFSRPDVNGSELFFNDLQQCRVIITTLFLFFPSISLSLPLSLSLSPSLSLFLSSFFYISMRYIYIFMEIARESHKKNPNCVNASDIFAILEDSPSSNDHF